MQPALQFPPEYVEGLLVEKAMRMRAFHVSQVARVTANDRLAKLFDALFPKQLAFAMDPNITNSALCTARAGKTFAGATVLIADASDPEHGFDTAYATITLKEAKRIMWNGPSGLKALNRQFDLGLAFNNSDLVATTPGYSQNEGHAIILNGAETEDDIEKLRGQPFRRVVIDEAQSFRAFIDALIQQVIFPRLMDYGGRLSLIGTPGLILAGLFYEVTTGKLPGWSVHRWSLRDNPHIPKIKTAEIPDVEAFLERVKRSFGWTDETPAYQREFEGRWVRDLSSLVYLYGARNVVQALPRIKGLKWNFAAAIDLGYSNKETCGFEVGAWSEDLPAAYLVEGFKRPKMSIDEIADELKRLQGKYPGIRFVGDPGGLGGQILKEIQLRHGIYIQLAEKSEKQAYIKTMNADLAAGRLYVVEGNPILKEWDELQWALRRDLKDQREEDPRFPNHLSDAGLYVWRMMLHFLHRPGEVVPAEGTEAYHAAMAAKMEQDDDDEAQREQRQGWWERD